MNNITNNDKLKQLQIDIQDDENQKEVNSFIVPSALSPYSPIQPTPPCSPNFSSSTSLSPSSTITLPQNGSNNFKSQHNHHQQQQHQQKSTSIMIQSCYDRDDHSGGWINNRPPTPDIRRSELDLADLSDGTRVLVIQDTYLRAGTLYLRKDSSSSINRNSLNNDYLRDQVFRIQLDTEKFVNTTNSRITSRNSFTSSSNYVNNQIASSSSTCLPSSSSSSSHDNNNNNNNNNNNCRQFTKNRRRQMDLLLYGWQVVQQAVLEVFPASIRHVPPGTRVCAAWSEQLGVNLYPGTVVKIDPKEQQQHQQHINNNDCVVPVDFDDGDHRQVPLTDLRILPDYFTNLCELINITGENNINSLIPCFISSNYLSPHHDNNNNNDNSNSNNNNNHGKQTEKFVSRTRRHSDLDHNTPRSYHHHHSWSQSTSPFIHLCSPEMIKNFTFNSKYSSFSEKNSNKSTHSHESNRSRKDSQLSSSSSNKTIECTINSLTSPTHTSSTSGTTSIMSLRSPSPPLSLQTPITIGSSNDFSIDKYNSECNNNNNSNDENKSEKEISLNDDDHHHQLSEEFNVDNVSVSSTITTTDSSNECLSWQVYEKFKRRKQGCTYCRSIIRDVDGLIVKVGDCVQFGSGRNEIYLGEVREIRWEHRKNSLLVVAAWYYQPLEAGKDGQLVQDIKGALFTTEHKDENEAKCIKRRIKVAKSYSQFIQGYYDKPKGQDTLKSNKTQLDINVERPTSRNDNGQINPGLCEPSSSTSTSTTTATTNPNNKYSLMEKNDEINSDDNDDDDDVDDDRDKTDCNFYHYFIAGKYDPVRQQVLAWDTELAKIFNLKIQKSR
ncbi:unnamed protein product [Schistosoma turkestanicum]|nr:unnamed protein product [Schistosoma turkestanicum]